MTGLESHTEHIIMLAWSRALGLDDMSLAASSRGERIDAVDEDAAVVSLVQLFGRTVLYGPATLLRAARDIPDEELALETRLLDIARPQYPGARILGETHLLYCEEPPELEGSDRLSVSHNPEHVRQLTTRSPADDVARSGVGASAWTASLVREDTGEVVAAAGRDVWQEILGDIGVLTHPSHRGLGLARFAAAVAVEEAFGEGLIPQWRAAVESPGSLRLAITLGFTLSGHQTTVTLG
ncbi:GNAT family N-acetyltransferase [Nesterenkonia natronophila]|uniref:GNAT family N-acetyltransferase n=1 Tax=Nesterenkonia natronophila TaxID=2174932 RepID=A0A3A4F319_9MICC|nr:GNAT family N-acetyltransferase [Nesterenkonia natronophila]RJN32453.1 GNAT family N-acetyltransferase [Nesterenkonia natronophila]